MALDRSSQPIVKDASGVLVGVAQVRVGKPSIRDAVTTTSNFATSLKPVGLSSKVISVSNANEIVIKPTTVYSPNTLSNPGTALTITAAGGYTGKIDGAYIFRVCTEAKKGKVAEIGDATAGTNPVVEVYDPYGWLCHTTTSLSAFGTMTASYGMVFSAAVFTGAKVGDTWVLPVWSKSAVNLNQTAIISPFSMFYDATDSIGGLKSASFQPKIDGVKKLESGFPSQVADQIIDKVSVDVGWSGYEYTNAKLGLLKQMIARVINTGELSAISVEMVMRTRGGSLVRMWIPSATFTSLPTYAPTNDYSDIAFQMSALKQTEFTTTTGLDSLDAAGLVTYNAWLADTPIYSELAY